MDDFDPATRLVDQELARLAERHGVHLDADARAALASKVQQFARAQVYRAAYAAKGETAST